MTQVTQHKITPQPLTAEAFAQFGDVIECRSSNQILTINEGLTRRHHDCADIQCLPSDTGDEGETIINLFQSDYRPFPVTLHSMERHPIGSQSFIPMHDKPYIIVVADPALEDVDATDLVAFITNGKQAINYHHNVWHHYLIAPFQDSIFAVVDRGGKGNNLQEIAIQSGPVLLEI